ncbi:MAG: adenylate/guanylate cyclase domain-containing protein [Actinomycetota bacterium]
MLDVPEIRYAKVGHAHVAYQVAGDGPVDLLLAPGFISHLDLQWTMPTFASFVEQLASFARVILFDKRGTGLSDPSPDAARFDQRVEDIEAVMNAAGSSRAVLFGMSEGGPLATLFATTHPERASKLVLYGTFASGSSLDRGLLRRFETAVDHWGTGLTAEVFMSPESRRMFARSYFGLFERASCSPGMARALLSSIEAVDVRPVLPALRVPTLLLHRRDDPFAETLWTDEIQGLVPNAKRIELDGDDHLPWLGDSRAIAEAVGEFVGGDLRTRPPARTVASLLFTDIVDSTHHAVKLGDHAWTRLLAEHNQVVRTAIETHRGREVKTLGDGFLSMFTTPGRALRCAGDIVRSVQPLGISIRAGVHTGEIEIVDVNDIAGITVHIAARIGAEAGPNEVLVSSDAKDLAVGQSLSFRSVGSIRLKGMPKPVAVSALEDGPPGDIDLAETRPRGFADRLRIRALRSAATLRRSMGRRSSAAPIA